MNVQIRFLTVVGTYRKAQIEQNYFLTNLLFPTRFSQKKSTSREYKYTFKIKTSLTDNILIRCINSCLNLNIYRTKYSLWCEQALILQPIQSENL